MAELKPYGYSSSCSRTYTTGMPTSKSSAIYSGYANWVFAPYFKNNTGYPIKIKRIKALIGMSGGSNGSAKAICGSTTGAGTPNSVSINYVSGTVSVPVQSSLSTWTIFNLTSEVIIPKNGWFYAGFKCDRNGTYNYLNIGRTNDKSPRSSNLYFYEMQSRNAGLSSAGCSSMEMVDAGNTWRGQIPMIYVDYDIAEISPGASKTSITINQGATDKSIYFSYSGWSIADSGDYLTVSKSGNYLQVKANWRSIDRDYSTTIKINGLNKTQNITVNVKVPSVSVSANKSSIRPNESLSLSYSTSDGYTISNNNISGISLAGVSRSGTTVSCERITTGGEDWQIDPLSSRIVKLVVTHPHNDSIKASCSFTVKHWSKNDLQLDVLSNSIFNIAGSFINYADNSASDAGKANISAKIVTDGTDQNVLSCGNGKIAVTQDYELGTNNYLQINYSLKYDYKVAKTLQLKPPTFNLIAWVPFGFILPVFTGSTDATSQYMLPLLYKYREDEDLIEINYSNFPIVLQVPTALLHGNLGVRVKNTYFVYYYNEKNGATKFVSKQLSNSYKSTEEIPIVNFSSSSTLVPGSEAWLIFNLLDSPKDLEPDYEIQKVTYTFVADYKAVDNTDESSTYSYTVRFKPIGKDFSMRAFTENAYPPGTPIQGQTISLNPFVSIINSLNEPIRSVLLSYNLMNESESVLPLPSNLYSKGSTISSQELIAYTEGILKKLNTFISVLNNNVPRTIGLVRSEIAIGWPIMWDDSVLKLADGSNNTFLQSEDYKIKTASPWLEMFNALWATQYGKDISVVYNPRLDGHTNLADKDYRVRYIDANSNTDSEVITRR